MSEQSSSSLRYPGNSSHAAGRIVALALIANGEVKPCEWAELKSMQVHDQLGLTREEWHDVVGDLYFELASSAKTLADCLADVRMIERLLDDIDDVMLRRRVLQLCMAVINADRQVDEGESAVLRAAVERWELSPEEEQLVGPFLYGLDFHVMPRRRPPRL